MLEYKDDQSDSNELAHSLDSELDGFDVPIMRAPGEQKVVAMENEELRGSVTSNAFPFSATTEETQ